VIGLAAGLDYFGGGRPAAWFGGFVAAGVNGGGWGGGWKFGRAFSLLKSERARNGSGKNCD